MTINKMARSFRYAGLILPDPAPELDVESVRSLYAASYPEITTAALTGPEAVDGRRECEVRQPHQEERGNRFSEFRQTVMLSDLKKPRFYMTTLVFRRHGSGI